MPVRAVFAATILSLAIAAIISGLGQPEPTVVLALELRR
jgi:hypothetical protein